MIYTFSDLLPRADCATQLKDGRWVGAIPLPFYEGAIGRVRDAWAVLTDRAVAVRWPHAGEFEAAMSENGWSAQPETQT